MRRLSISAPWLALFLLVTTPAAQGCHNPMWDGEGLILTDEGPRLIGLRHWGICDGPTVILLSYREAGDWRTFHGFVTGSFVGGPSGGCVDPCGFSLGSTGAFTLTNDEEGISLAGTWASHGTLLVESEWSVTGTVDGYAAAIGYWGLIATRVVGTVAQALEDGLP